MSSFTFTKTQPTNKLERLFMAKLVEASKAPITREHLHSGRIHGKLEGLGERKKFQKAAANFIR